MRFTLLLVLAAIISACASPSPVSPTASPPASAAGSIASASAAGPAVTASASTPASSPGSSVDGQSIVGAWKRTQSCEDQLAAYTSAGLLDKAQEWVTANWVGEQATAVNGKFCEGSAGPREHSHFFTTDGLFGSLDEHGAQVDDGHYVLKDAHTIQFPDHDFGYPGGPVVRYSVSADTATFSVTLPDPCTGACRQAYAWALSAFFGSDPWTRQPGQ